VEHDIPKAGLKSGEEAASEKVLFSIGYDLRFFQNPTSAINIPEANTLIAGFLSHFTFFDGVFIPCFDGIFSTLIRFILTKNNGTP
jgi:hypothetical protein